MADAEKNVSTIPNELGSRIFQINQGIECITQGIDSQLDVVIIDDKSRSHADNISDLACATGIEEHTLAHAVADDLVSDPQ